MKKKLRNGPPEKSAAPVTIHRAPDMTPPGRKEVAAWLRWQATTLTRHASKLSDRFTARYMYPALALLGLALGTSCVGPTPAYVEADRGIYEAVAPAHAAYVQADANLTQEQKDRRLRTLETWRRMLVAAEAATAPAGGAK